MRFGVVSERHRRELGKCSVGAFEHNDAGRFAQADVVVAGREPPVPEQTPERVEHLQGLGRLGPHHVLAVAEIANERVARDTSVLGQTCRKRHGVAEPRRVIIEQSILVAVEQPVGQGIPVHGRGDPEPESICGARYKRVGVSAAHEAGLGPAEGLSEHVCADAAL